VSVQEISVDTARSADETRKQSWDEQHEPGPPPQVPEHAVAVGDPVVPVLLGADDLDLDAAAANVVDGVRDEPTRGVSCGARVRRRQDGDAHQLSTRKTA
jgi:hypothetical protein